MTTNDYTPLESLLLFQSLLKFGVEQQAFHHISDLLIKNDLIRNSDTYDAARLSPDRLYDLFLKLLRNGIPAADDSQDPAKSPNSRKRKVATPLSPSLAEAREHIEKLPAFVYHLYDCYVKDAVAQVHKYDDQFGKAKRELEQIQAAHSKVEPQNGAAAPDAVKDQSLLNGRDPSQHSQSTEAPKPNSASRTAQENKAPVHTAVSQPSTALQRPPPTPRPSETPGSESRIAPKPMNGTQQRLQPAPPQQQSPQLVQTAPLSQTHPQPQPQAPQQAIHSASRSGQQHPPTPIQKPPAPVQQSPYPSQPYTAPQPPTPQHAAPHRPVSHPTVQKAASSLSSPGPPQHPAPQQPAVHQTGPQRPNAQPTGPQRPDHQQIGPHPTVQSSAPVLRHPQVSSSFGAPKPITPGPPPVLPVAEVSKRPETTAKSKPQPHQQPQLLKWEPVVTSAPVGPSQRHHQHNAQSPAGHPQQQHAVVQPYKHPNLRTPAMQSPTPGIASQLQAPSTGPHHPVLVAPSNVSQIAPPPVSHLQPLQPQPSVKACNTSPGKSQGRAVPPATQQHLGAPGQQFYPGYPQHPQTARTPIPPPQPPTQAQAARTPVSAPAAASIPPKPAGTTQPHPHSPDLPPRQGLQAQDLSGAPMTQSQTGSQSESQQPDSSPYNRQSTRPLLPEHLAAQQSTPTPSSRRNLINNFPKTPASSNIPTPIVTGSGTRWVANPTPGTPRPEVGQVSKPEMEPLSPRVTRATAVAARPDNYAQPSQKSVISSPAKPSQILEKHGEPVADRVQQEQESPVRKLSQQNAPKTLEKVDTSVARATRQSSRGTSKSRSGANVSSTRRHRSKSVASTVDEFSPDATDTMTTTVKEEVATPGIPDELEDKTADESLPARAAPSTPSRVTQKRPKRKREDTPPAPPTSARQSPPPNVWWTRSFPKVSASALDQIGSHRYANMFANPVKGREAPGYRDIVLQPQDIKSIRAAILAGNRAASAAANALPGGDPGTSYVRLPISEDLVPPRGIINSGQLECELMHMFANAIMYNPDPDHGPGLAFRKQDQEQGDEEAIGYQVDENRVVKDTRAMSMEVEKLLSELRAAEKDRAPEPDGFQGAPLSISRLPSASVASASRGSTAAPEERETQDELATDPETVNMGLSSSANTPVPNPPKRRRYAHSTAAKS